MLKPASWTLIRFGHSSSFPTLLLLNTVQSCRGWGPVERQNSSSDPMFDCLVDPLALLICTLHRDGVNFVLRRGSLL